MTDTNAASSNLSQPNAENAYTVTTDDLPLHCPLPGTSLWNSHPRVYLPIEDTGSAKCSYCGAVFTLDK
ncbi:MAG: zinc-finger domain-containing protein [Gammaproteobacteria bacterium]